MPKPPERGNLEFNPPLAFGSDRFKDAWEILKDLQASNTVVFHYVGNHQIKGLSFETREQAMIFKLRHR